MIAWLPFLLWKRKKTTTLYAASKCSLILHMVYRLQALVFYIVVLSITIVAISNQAQAKESFDGRYLIPPKVQRGILFDFETIRYKDNLETESQPQSTVLEGFIKSIDTMDSPNLKPIEPLVAPKGKLIEGLVKKQELNLKKLTPKAQEQNRKMMVLRAIRNHGTTGILLVAYFNGPWIIHTVLKGTPAEKYGLRAGDVIESINGEPIRGMSIERVYFRITGRRGQPKSFRIKRRGKHLKINLPLWSIYDIKYRRSQYIEYYWYLLYNKVITNSQYKRLVKRFIYFNEPTLRAPVKHDKTKIYKKSR